MKQRFFQKRFASHFAFIMSIALILGATMHPEIAVGKEINAEKYIKMLDRRAEKIKKQIRQTKSKIEVTGKTYYVSTDGNDYNDGLTPNSPIKSIDKVNSLRLNAGDAVLFNRGGLWRGHIKSQAGVTYSAYGKGEKPKIYGSPCDAAKEGVWRETETKNVWVYEREIAEDIGTLVFNSGEACAFKVMKITQENGPSLHIKTKEKFESYRDLKRDLEFYHDYKEAKRVYLYSAKGNPAERFESIELLTKGHIIQANDNIVVDNLCLKYCGSHGIGSGTTKGLTVTNCELGWIGGSIQAEGIFGRNHPTRYGNAIEIYGACDFYLVDNCYIYQVYDAAITHQHQGDGTNALTMKDITYSNNLVEDCVYSIEYFLGYPRHEGLTHKMYNIVMCNNLLRRTGEGWGKQRPDITPIAQIKSWAHYNPASDFVIRDNVFDRSTHHLLNIDAGKTDWLPTLKNNVYIQYKDAKGVDCKGSYKFDENIGKHLKELYNEDNATIIFVE
ncbi:MAG: hypothetical protein IKV18_03085 [Alistipes sp.]|nr:hypothetical protein [Alistipes sp.]